MLERKRGLGQAPFHTTDAILAFSLYLAGVPFYEERKPCINIYDENILKRLGLTGMSIEDGVKRALATKKKGHVEYGFKRTPSLNGLLRAYKQQEEYLRDAEGTAVAVVNRLASDLKDGVNPETVVRLACTILKMRVQFVNIWQQIDPLIRVFNEGEVETVSENGVTKRRYPGFRMINLHASKETREKLNL